MQFDKKTNEIVQENTDIALLTSKRGYKMIHLGLSIFTTNIEQYTKEFPAVWDTGNISLKSNPDKKIKSDVIIFHGFDEIPIKLKELLKRNNISVLHKNINIEKIV